MSQAFIRLQFYGLSVHFQLLSTSRCRDAVTFSCLAGSTAREGLSPSGARLLPSARAPASLPASFWPGTATRRQGCRRSRFRFRESFHNSTIAHRDHEPTPGREIIDAILLPSATIAVGYNTTILETRDGEELQGIIKQVTDEWIESCRELTGILMARKWKNPGPDFLAINFLALVRSSGAGAAWRRWT